MVFVDQYQGVSLYAADVSVSAANNTVVTAAIAEQRLAERVAAIEAKWGATMRDGARRLSP